MSKSLQKLLVALLLSISSSTANALEYYVTDVQGNSLAGGTLDLGQNPISKTVYVYLKYTQAEANTINGVGTSGPNQAGLFSGSFQLNFANSGIALVNTSSNIAQGTYLTGLSSLQWTPSLQIPSSGVQNAKALFTATSSPNPRYAVPNPISPATDGYIQIGQVVISPGATVNPSGTLVTLGMPSGGTWISSNTNSTSRNTIWATPTALTFTVVPEPSTIAMGLISGISLVATGFYRRRQVKMSKSIV